jgi:hypothetical protein
MVYTIPAVGRGKHRWATSALAHLVGATGAALLFGGLVAGVLSLGTRYVGSGVLTMTVAIGLAVLGAIELGILKIALPQRHRQVPPGWRAKLMPEITSALYGALLAIGITTRIPFASFYGVILLAVTSGSFVKGAIIFGCFGIARAAIPSLLSPFVITIEDGDKITFTLLRFRGAVSRINGIVMLIMSISLFVRL